MSDLASVKIGASRTHVRKNKVKILQNTEALFEKLCYLTKVSLKAGEGTKILIDVSDLANCLGVSERTVRRHLKSLDDLGVVNRLADSRHIYELSDLVLGDIMQKKRHKFLRVYLKANVNAEKSVDNSLICPSLMDKLSVPHIYKTKDKSNKSRARIFSKKGDEDNKRPKSTTVQDMDHVMSEVFEKDWNLDKRLCRLMVAAMKLKFKTLGRFRDYCEAIKKSWIYFSKRIRSKIHYMLKFGVIEKFLPRECYVLGDSEAVESDASKFAEEHICNVVESARCKDTRRRILMKYGGLQYKTWLTQVTLAENKYGEVVLDKVPNGFVGDYVDTKFLKLL